MDEAKKLKKKFALLTILVLLFVTSTLTAYAQIGEEEEGIIGEGKELEDGVVGEGEGLEEGVIGEGETELETERDLPGFESALALAGILAAALLLRRR